MSQESNLDSYGCSLWTRKHGMFYKVFLEIDLALRSDNSGLFSGEWDNVRRDQIRFLLERPLMFKVLTEKVWGPAELDSLSIEEWWEAEKELRNKNREREIEELSDMALLLLTFDSLNPNLSLDSQKKVISNMVDTVVSYCDELGLNNNDLVVPAKNKIKINKLRNPKEAFMLMENEPMQMSIDRRKHNWLRLKEKRERHSNLFTNLFTEKEDWWKKWLYVDKNGWVRERVH